MAFESSLDGPETTENLICFAKVAEQAERFDDMAKAMKKVTAKEKKLTTEHRNLFSVAYKNVVGARRSSWRVISMIEQKNDIGKQKDLSKEMRKRVEAELDNTCSEVIEQLDALIKDVKDSAEDEVFYLKMKGDYYRYQAEYKDDDDLKNKADKAYEQALKVANGGENGDGKTLNPTHPNRLGLALNYSVFYYEILNKPDKACELAKKAFDDAAIELNSNLKQEGDNKDSTLIMQLLRDNLTLWTSDAQENGVETQD